MIKKDVYAFWAWVEKRMEELSIPSISKLEKLAKTSNGAISKRKRDYKYPTVEMAESMCYALQVSWCELWEHAGFEQLSTEKLTGLDAEIIREMKDVNDDFKKAVLKTIKTWLVLYHELRKEGRSNTE